MNPAGAGGAAFDARSDDNRRPAFVVRLERGVPAPRDSAIAIERVHSVLARAQRLVDSAPADGHPTAWCVEAALIGDLAAAAASATFAAHSTATAA
jgi:hypothetical protein